MLVGGVIGWEEIEEVIGGRGFCGIVLATLQRGRGERLAGYEGLRLVVLGLYIMDIIFGYTIFYSYYFFFLSFVLHALKLLVSTRIMRFTKHKLLCKYLWTKILEIHRI